MWPCRPKEGARGHGRARELGPEGREAPIYKKKFDYIFWCKIIH